MTNKIIYVIYQNISEWLILDSRLSNRIQCPSNCISHLLPPEKHQLAYVLDDIVMHFLYAQITFENALLFPNV